MANGFFLGGAAEGMLESRKAGLAEQTQDQDVALRTRALDINEKQFGAEQSRKDTTRLDENISNTMAIIGEVIKAGTEGGKPPAQIQAAIEPLVKSAQMLAKAAGRDPNAIAAQAQAQLFQPNPIERAAVSGAATATQAVSQDRTERNLLSAAQPGGSAEPELSRRYKTAKERTDVENSLRDDYVKQAQPFITVRDYYSNFKQAENTGAGDIARVFAFMKIQDPGSAVLPGEAASAQNAAGVPEAIRGMYNKLIGGGVLTPGARDQLASQAEKLYGARAVQHDRLTTQFAGIAKRQGLSANNVIIDLSLPAAPSDPSAGPSPNQQVNSRFPANMPAPPAGFVVQ